MSQLVNGTNYGDIITLSKDSGAIITLHTSSTYMDKNVVLIVSPQSGSIASTTDRVFANPVLSILSNLSCITAYVSTDATISIPVVTSGWVKDMIVTRVPIQGYVSLSLPMKSSETFTPGVSDQIISSGTYLTGIQTIKGDSNLLASNIRSGVSIYGVVGTMESIVFATTSEVLEYLGIA